SIYPFTYYLFSHTTPPTSDLSPLSLHDALPIYCRASRAPAARGRPRSRSRRLLGAVEVRVLLVERQLGPRAADEQDAYFDCAKRSEEHTSELQSRENLVCRLLLEKKKKKKEQKK